MKNYKASLQILFVGIMLVSCSYKQTQIASDVAQLRHFPYTIEQLEKKLKTSDFDINTRYLVDEQEETLLYMAAEQNNLEMVKFLVAHGAIIEHNGSWDNYHPLHATTDLRTVEFFLQNGVDPDTGSGMACVSLLHRAAAQGDLEMAKLCFKYNADPNSRLGNGDNMTPLMVTCSFLKNTEDLKWWGPERKHTRQYFEVIKLLVKNGADVRAFSNHMDTALDLAEYAENKQVVAFLKEELRKKRPYPYTLKELEKKVTDQQFDVNAACGDKWDRFGRTLLALAAYNDDLPYVKFLIDHGAKCKDSAPLEAAARYGNAQIMRLLLETKPNFDEKHYSWIKPAPDQTHYSWIMSPLATACLYCNAGNSSHFEVIKLLVNSGADLNDESTFGKTPLILLVVCHTKPKKDDPGSYTWEGNIDAVEFLLKHGAKVGAERMSLIYNRERFEDGTILNLARSLSLTKPDEIKLKNLLEKYLKING
jgi:ankyrin repeat protein